MSIESLSKLLDELDAAVVQGRWEEARELVRRIEQGIVAESVELTALEQRLNLLKSLLETPAAAEPEPEPEIPDRKFFSTERALGGEEDEGGFEDEEEVEAEDEEEEGGGGAAPRDKGHVYPVWFGTNRRPVDLAQPSRGFTAGRHVLTTYGRVDVWVPEAHRFGETGTSFFTRLKRFDLRDDHLRVQEIVGLEAAAFWKDLQAQMQAARDRGDAPDALVFLHGYNTTFEEAAIRAAQLGVDLKVPGATAFFSWPSCGTLQGYPADEATIDASERAITQFLVDFSRQCGAKQVHLVAHSMGNRGLLRALQRIAANAETAGSVKFGQIFLAAPDVDRDLFLELAYLYPTYSTRTTLYASDGDRAVHMSARLHGYPRAGYFKPYTVAKDIDTVAVPNFDIDMLGHGYFAQAEALLHDIYDLMGHDAPPGKRQRIKPEQQDGLELWKVSL